MKRLIGKTITGLQVSEGEEVLDFLTTEGTMRYVCNADCCSETWFADIIGLDALLNNTVVACQDIDLSTYNIEDGRTRQDEDEVYGHRLVTAKGHCDIIYRNSSNGYYGGGCDLEYITCMSDAIMRDITEDWRA